MLALGLPSSFKNAGLFHPSQWWYWQLCHRSYRILDVPSSRCCCSRWRYVFKSGGLHMQRRLKIWADEHVIADARRISGEPEGSEYIPSDPREFANRIFHTCYMGTENSSIDTRRRAKELSEAIGRFVVMTYPYLYSHSRHALWTVITLTWTWTPLLQPSEIFSHSWQAWSPGSASMEVPLRKIWLYKTSKWACSM